MKSKQQQISTEVAQTMSRLPHQAGGALWQPVGHSPMGTKSGTGSSYVPGNTRSNSQALFGISHHNKRANRSLISPSQ